MKPSGTIVPMLEQRLTLEQGLKSVERRRAAVNRKDRRLVSLTEGFRPGPDMRTERSSRFRTRAGHWNR
uniref:Uncharacterized protein n=1 Tax=Anopheles stephensi TaxID=30069 RepID=A0A182YG07_ANOST